ncbi:MAG: cyclodeaminase/cyclohydrolase family protein [Candidatus Omnitrophica bacterium]|nr:cyclodeaminase/cyclohydrolase family protein [Candidatus Omnitrophota bacterium]MDE2222576.1 cyclodeaminase/cyclohydrolase family protein [Candidatus Omnitrophota bacterium]
MKVDFKNKTLHDYLDQLSRREPVPGGGSAAALTASLGAGLISMVTNYSLGRKTNSPAVEKRLAGILAQSEPIRLRFLELTSLDSEAYLKISAARSLDKQAQKRAAREARAIPQEVCKLCFKAIQLTPYLVEKGNPYLLSDVEVAVELLLSAFNAARVMVRVNS